MAFADNFSGLRARLDRLSDRERLMVSILGLAVLAIAVLGVGFAIANGLSDLEDGNAEMRQALKDIETNRDSYQRAKAKTAQLEVRMGHGDLQLQGFLEQSAKEAGVEIAETAELPAAPAGKKYVERGVTLRLRKVNLDGLTRFLRKVETGPNLVAVTQLNVRGRDDKHEDFEVEMTVSTWQHKPEDKAHKKEKG